MARLEKICLWGYLALLGVVLLFYRHIDRLCLVYIGEGLSSVGFIILGAIASILIFVCTKGEKNRFWWTLLSFVLISFLLGGLFQGVDWVMEHVKITP